MDPWLARAEGLCYEGEEVTESVTLGEGGVVVTTHRVMVFSPQDDGENFQYADRPNVESVRRANEGERAWLERAIKLLVVGGLLTLVGFVIDLEGLVGDVSLSGGGQVGGLGSAIGMVQQLLAVLAIIDDLVVLAGGLALLAAAALFGVYLQTRAETLRVSVAGSEDLTRSVAEWPDADVVGRLEQAIAPTPRSPATDQRTNSGPDGRSTEVRSGDDPLA